MASEQRWYVVVNDLIGGWDVSTVDKPASQHDYQNGDVTIAWGMGRREWADEIVALHNGHAALTARLAAAESERDAARRTLALATDVTVLVGGVALSARQLEAQRNAAYAERDELIRHKDTNDCTRYGHRWRDAFGPDGALCQCGGMVFAVWASDIREGTDWERAHPRDVRVIENPERSALARDMEDAAWEVALSAAASSTGADAEAIYCRACVAGMHTACLLDACECVCPAQRASGSVEGRS